MVAAGADWGGAEGCPWGLAGRVTVMGRKAAGPVLVLRERVGEVGGGEQGTSVDEEVLVLARMMRGRTGLVAMAAPWWR